MDELIIRVQLHRYLKTRKYTHDRPPLSTYTIRYVSDIILAVNYNCGS